jgi:hypothetical protein
LILTSGKKVKAIGWKEITAIRKIPVNQANTTRMMIQLLLYDGSRVNLPSTNPELLDLIVKNSGVVA